MKKRERLEKKRDLFIWDEFYMGQTLFDSMDYTLPGSSAHGILQARILERVPIPFSRGLSQPRNRTPRLLFPALPGRLFATGATWELSTTWFPKVFTTVD